MTNPTERLARASLELHRLAKTADELRHLASPVTPREANAKGVSDPTANAVMCPRRLAVVDAHHEALFVAATLADEIEQRSAALASVLDAWEGLKS